jgi:putative spermidine/putrescine transport system substrate-binding protein
MSLIQRRGLLAAGLALPAIGARTQATEMMAAVYPGGWDDALRAVLAPRLLQQHNVTVAFDPLFAVDQIAKARAARGTPPFDVFVLDPGPRVSGMDLGLFETFDPARLPSRAVLPDGYADNVGAAVAAQVVGIAYNPNKVPKPAGWRDLFRPEYATKLGLTGFGTISLIEMAKALGGSETKMDPLFAELRRIRPTVAAVAQPAAMPDLFQQGQIDVMYTNTYTVTLLRSRGVPIAFAVPESGAAAFVTTLHIARNSRNIAGAYQYIDAMISTPVQSALSLAPYFFVPVNKEVTPGADVPMRSISEITNFVTHDWTRINPLRAGWISRFNREMAG